MNSNAKIGPAPPVTVAASGSSAGGDFSQSRAGEEAERAARYRLVIEEGARRGTFVYKTLDRVTGEVVRQLPREEIQTMLERGDYAAGKVIDTNA
jgi:flagellar protein FlaG